MPIPGMPPSPSPMAPANAGPAVMPQGNPGNSALAMVDIQNAVKMLEKSLPMIPMGSPLHTKILTVVKDLAKELGEGGSQPQNQGLNIQSLMQMLKSSAQQPGMGALAKMMPGAGGQTPPAMPQPSPEPSPAAA